MAESDYVEPLTGEEIRNDLLFQIDKKLSQDCNLRESDSYQSGYSAVVTVKLKAYGMDTAEVESEIVVGKDKPLDPEKDVEITTELEVPVEPALDQVRERSDQPVPTLIMEGGKPMIKPRKYLRKGSLPGGGGATGESL